jgi:hypothetical protein
MMVGVFQVGGKVEPELSQVKQQQQVFWLVQVIGPCKFRI